MDSISKLIEDSGHAAQHRPARRGGTAADLLMEGQLLEQQILKLMEDDPVGGAQSHIGRFHMQRYGFLCGSLARAEEHAGCKLFNSVDRYGFLTDARERIERQWREYPTEFELRDVLLESKWIMAQMAVEDCWAEDPEDECAPDTCPTKTGEWSPFTTDAYIGVFMGPEGAEPLAVQRDPFAMDEEEIRDRLGKVTVEVEETGERVSYGDSVPAEAPKEGFKEAHLG